MGEFEATSDVVTVEGGMITIAAKSGRIARMRSKVKQPVTWPADRTTVELARTDTMGQWQATFTQDGLAVVVVVGQAKLDELERFADEHLGGMLNDAKSAELERERRLFERTAESQFGITVRSGQVTHGKESGPLLGSSARVETAGDIQSRFTATRLVGLGPLALAFKKKKDKRELYLTVEGADFSFVVALDPDKGEAARKFAAKLNSLARQPNNEPATTAAPSASAGSAADELAKFAAMHRDGILTDEEFAAQKVRLLGG